ncbi:hypothetical protein DPMN_130600 [Dreissena polymorpha]|uniref:Uncharacterized protein n=1 Tax=Dreissena polymorpha TaxID=45954 RepID=A0A9D4K1W5_DREPO|nr:hypothetical protein DPMN_130600 [Dreissena polymorpha]
MTTAAQVNLMTHKTIKGAVSKLCWKTLRSSFSPSNLTLKSRSTKNDMDKIDNTESKAKDVTKRASRRCFTEQ